MFIKYQHIERFGTIETDGIEIGTVHVFPKIDGTNASVWREDGSLQFGSRNRHLQLNNDNAGFMESMVNNEGLRGVLGEQKDWHLFGEWLVPHTLKTYDKSAWGKFYVFDVSVPDGDGWVYIPYDEYKPVLDKYGVEYIPPLRVIKNPTEERLISYLDVNQYLIQDGCGTGEGLVIKNYEYRNRFGRQTWAKIVRNEFKKDNAKLFGGGVLQERKLPEEIIVAEFQTQAMVDKIHANIISECDGWSSKFISRLLNTVYHDLIKEECWNFVKKLKNPKIDFGRLMKISYTRTKEMKPELFS